MPSNGSISVNALGRHFGNFSPGSTRARVLVILTLLVVIAASIQPWIRPPISKDIRGIDISLIPTNHEPELLLNSSSGMHLPSPISIGGLLIIVAVTGVGWILLRPQHLELFAGILLCVAVAGMSATVLNHPQLIDLLQQESAQRQQIASFADSADLELLVSPANSRESQRTLLTGQYKNTLGGLAFLATGPALVGYCLLLLLASVRGPLRQRFQRLIIWFTLSMSVAALFSSQRILAELYWHKASTAEQFGAVALSRSTLETSIDIFPQFDRLARTWALEGKLDYLDGFETPRARYYLASLQSDIGDLDTAISLLSNIESTRSGPDTLVRHQLAHYLVQSGIRHFYRENWATADIALREARSVDPENCSALFATWVVQDRLQNSNPQEVEELFKPCLARIGDRVLRADLLAILGDVHFMAGNFTQAREKYLVSLKAFHLPKRINYRAQRGLTGF